jgi:hypothetical protein
VLKVLVPLEELLALDAMVLLLVEPVPELPVELAVEPVALALVLVPLPLLPELDVLPADDCPQ